MPTQKPSVLFVMEDDKLRSILVSRFEREGWKAMGAENLEEGERKAVRFRPRIFVVELTTPLGMEKLVKHLRSLPTLHSARLSLFLKGPARMHVDEALKAGADTVMLWGTVSPRDMVKSFAKLLTSDV